MRIKTCEICQKQFNVKAYRVDKARFCSSHCYGIHRKGKDFGLDKKVIRVCVICGHDFKVSPYRADTALYCSASCRSKGQAEKVRGDKCHFWKGGKWINQSGYILISIKGKQVYEHRYVMEQFLKRSLLPNEDVHHINGVKTDNRIENLEVCLHPNHIGDHTKKRWELGIFF